VGESAAKAAIVRKRNSTAQIFPVRLEKLMLRNKCRFVVRERHGVLLWMRNIVEKIFILQLSLDKKGILLRITLFFQKKLSYKGIKIYYLSDKRAEEISSHEEQSGKTTQ
jgi:hypothetical protein